MSRPSCDPRKSRHWAGTMGSKALGRQLDGAVVIYTFCGKSGVVGGEWHDHLIARNHHEAHSVIAHGQPEAAPFRKMRCR